MMVLRPGQEENRIHRGLVHGGEKRPRDLARELWESHLRFGEIIWNQALDSVEFIIPSWTGTVHCFQRPHLMTINKNIL